MKQKKKKIQSNTQTSLFNRPEILDFLYVEVTRPAAECFLKAMFKCQGNMVISTKKYFKI